MTTINISLPDALKAFVDEQATAYGSASEYVRELIRKERDRRLRALVLEGLESGPAEPVEDSFLDDLRASIRSTGAA